MAGILGGAQKAYLVLHTAAANGADKIDTAKIANDTDSILKFNNITGGTMAFAAAAMASMKNVKLLEVQYNPSSLSLQANAQSIPFSSLQQSVDSKLPNQNVRPPQVVLGVDLLFDAVDVNDSFMAEKFSMNPLDMAKNAASMLIKRKHTFTVQPQTNGLIALLLSPATRLVTFRWASMAFTGLLTEASAEYTMFSTAGRPVRSRVHLNLSQNVSSKSDVTYWSKAIDRAFQDKSEMDLKGVGQKMGNLINLNGF